MNIFRKKPTVIGMVHFSALEGTEHYENDKELALERARQDLAVLQRGGVDMVMFENNFDTPKFAILPESVATHFEELLQALAPETHVPWGISPLWNDYRFGFAMCKKYGGIAVRVPVFVDSVETVYGVFVAEPEKVLAVRTELGADQIVILADVQVKHAKMINPRPFKDSVLEAVERGADGIIITGQWTGDPPSADQCAEARSLVPSEVAILTGSGMTAENIKLFAPHLDACIVGTAFKQGDTDVTRRSGPNIVEADRRFDQQKIKRFMEEVIKIRDKKAPVA